MNDLLENSIHMLLGNPSAKILSYSIILSNEFTHDLKYSSKR